MTIYTDVFGGANIYPSEISYSAVSLTTDIILSWPEETSTNENLATRIMDVTPNAAGRIITLPDASKTGTGQTILFNNRGSYTFTVKDAAGVQVVTIAPATLWQVYLSNNTTTAGVWRSLQYGAATSSVNASSLAGTGIIAIGTLLSQSVPVTEFNSNYTAGVNDRAKMYNWTGSLGTMTLPVAATVSNNWFIYVRNSGSGQLTVDAPGSVQINGASFLNFQPGDSAIVASDGVNFYTIGFGQNAVFAFDYTVIDIAGTGNYTLAGSELNRISYKFIGVLTGNRTVIVPATVQQYWVNNQTTGESAPSNPYTLTIASAGGGSDVVISQGTRAIVYCDGTNILDAYTAGISLPISVSQGGTSATTASGARINLGGTSVGIALFTASDQAAAWSALGVAQAGNINGGAF